MNTQINELSDKQLEELGEQVSNKMISYFESKSRITRDKALHNTKLLLRNYNKLAGHCRVVGAQLEEDRDTFWNDYKLDLSTLMQNKAKTVKILKQVDKALEYYKGDCMKAKTVNESRRYDMIKMKYLNREQSSDDDIADRYDVARTTVSRNIDGAVDDISIILFGVEAFINH